jgi:hypothetical protein
VLNVETAVSARDSLIETDPTSVEEDNFQEGAVTRPLTQTTASILYVAELGFIILVPSGCVHWQVSFPEFLGVFPLFGFFILYCS